MNMPSQIGCDQTERLVKKFKNLSTNAHKAHNENNTRQDFILPLFRALEWDTQDSNEVAAEEKISRGIHGGGIKPVSLQRLWG